MTVENLLSHQFIDDWLSFHARKQLYCGKQKQNYCKFFFISARHEILQGVVNKLNGKAFNNKHTERVQLCVELS